MKPFVSTDLHPDTLAIVDALVDSALDDYVAPTVTEEALARYACGWITPEERDVVEAALVGSQELRERLIGMSESLAKSEGSPEARSEVFKSDSVLKSVMLSAFRQCTWALSNWGTVCAHRDSYPDMDIDEKRSLRSILVGIGKRMDAVHPSLAFAASRSVAAAKTVVEPGNVFADLNVHVQGKSLVAKAKFSKPFAEPKEVSLYVIEQGGAWSWLGSSTARGDEWAMKAPQFAAMLGLKPGDVATHNFALSEGRWFLPRGWIPVRISEDLRARGVKSPMRLRLKNAPAVRDGMFVLSFEFPEALRQVFLNDMLTLSLDFGGSSFALGAWKVRDLDPLTEVTLSAPSMGVPDGDFEMHSAITLTLRPPTIE